MTRLAPRWRYLALPGALVAATLALPGCENARQALGIDRSTPDEFVVVSRPPLTMPPDYRLRPPRPGAAAPGQPGPQEAARQTVFGVPPAAAPQPAAVAPAPGQSPAEAVFLARAGAGAAQPNIRATVDRESAVLARADETFLDRLLHWREAELRGTVIDAEAEARRLQQNQALGQPVTAGDTPTIERKRRGLLEGVFGF